MDEKAITIVVGAFQSLARDERREVLARLARDTTDEREKIETAIASAQTIEGAARVLGCSRKHLQDRMRELNMPRGKPGRRARPVDDVGSGSEVIAKRIAKRAAHGRV